MGVRKEIKQRMNPREKKELGMVENTPADGGFLFKKFVGGVAMAATCLAFAGCSHTYPPDKVQQAIQEICHKEYGVDKIQVKIAGKTIGVFLPIKKLFATNFKEALSKGNMKVADLENLFRPAPEALEQVEDVLFSISRVILSTDRKLEFYVLQAADMDETGLQLALEGYVDDIKRVRFWDISRDEYRKRVLHEIKLNRALVWHRPVRSFFETLEQAPSLKKIGTYFAQPMAPEVLQTLFYVDPKQVSPGAVRWNLGELRSTPIESNSILVYVPATIEYDPKALPQGAVRVPPGSSLEYFFVVSFAAEQPQIVRVIPLSYVDNDKKIQRIPLPEAMDLEKDLGSWETEFSISEIHLGDFLAEQLSRRTQTLLYSDERVHNTFEKVNLQFRYHQEEPKTHFSLELDLKLKSPVPTLLGPSLQNEDVLYLLNLTSREFVSVLRSYQFSDYEFLQLNLSADPAAHILGKEDLELLRRNKIDLQGLLGKVSPF